MIAVNGLGFTTVLEIRLDFKLAVPCTSVEAAPATPEPLPPPQGLPDPVDEEGQRLWPYIVHYTKRTRFTKLHKRGGCWRRPGYELKEVTFHKTLSDAPFMDFCTDCWPRSAPASGEIYASSSDSSDTP